MAAVMPPGLAGGHASHTGAPQARALEGLAHPPLPHAGPTLVRLGSGVAALALPLVAAPLAVRALGAKRLRRRVAARKCGVTVIAQAESIQPQAEDNEPWAEVDDDTPVEQVYKKLNQLEHILLRPDTYVGSTERQESEIWTFDEESQSIVLKPVSFVPALYKIFDEILVNAADNAVRDSRMNLIKVSINRSKNTISIYNNGAGIPVQKHETYDTWVPELIFGQLLTGANFDDSQTKVTGGRNGYGAKLANIFSRSFEVETVDKKRKFKYTQRFTNNMTEREEPTIEGKCKEDSYTQIKFEPDLQRFGMSALDDEIVNLMRKRVYDMAACTNCRVMYNGEHIDIQNFKDYISLYSRAGAISSEILTGAGGKRWEVGVAASDGQFRSVSFVNSICTHKGGTHVEHVFEQVLDPIIKKVRARVREQKLAFDVDKKGRRLVRQQTFVFVKCLIENPTFSSQTKEFMTLQPSKFGSSCKLQKKFASDVAAGQIAQTAVNWVEAKAVQAAKEAMKGGRGARNVKITKLEDAAWAGHPDKSAECTLIITEGDSAKANAVAGLSVVGRKRFGVYPLRGKILNVRTASIKQVTENAIINDIAKAIGLERGKSYKSIEGSGLRYGSVMLMCDQDPDGSHIKGLTLNLFQQWWPSLLKVDGFLKEFATPIVKAFKKGKEAQCFYSVHAFEEWREQNKDAKGWTTKYYKGLGTSTDTEMREYFKDLDKHTTKFCWTNDDAVPAMDLAFDMTNADQRKTWISNFAAQAEKPQRNFEDSVIDVGTYVNTELVQYSLYDSERSIPSMVDGLKPSQRKVLYALLNSRAATERRVSELIGLVSKEAAYHHGDTALGDTIVKMAQTFVGANNLNLLEPRGQFGTRGQAGADRAAHRYLWTRLGSIARKVFPKEDDAVLEYRIDDGEAIEPMWYCPVIPLSIVNGQKGIGTGWSTDIPNYNPLEIIDILRDLLNGEQAKDIKPWYKNFRGNVVGKGKNYHTEGVIKKKSRDTWSITEIPIGITVEKFRANLTSMIGERKQGVIVREVTLGDKHGNDSIEINIRVTSGHKFQKTEEVLMDLLGLKKKIQAGNLTLWTATGGMKRYESAKEIIEDFYPTRLQLYERRRTWLLASLERELKSLSEELLFVSRVVDGELEIMGRPLGDVNKDLQTMGFRTRDEIQQEEEEAIKAMSPTASKAVLTPAEGDTEPTRSAKDQDDQEGRDYSHLLDKPLRSVTNQAVERLRRKVNLCEAELNKLRASTAKDLWQHDLAQLEAELREDPGYADRQPEAMGEDVERDFDDGEEESVYDSDDDDDDDDDYMGPMKAEVRIQKPKLKAKPKARKPKLKAKPKARKRSTTEGVKGRTRINTEAIQGKNGAKEPAVV